MPGYTELKGILNTQDATISELLLDNFVQFYDWGLLSKGGFYNINIPSSGLHGGNKSNLVVRKDERYTNGQVWEGYRGNWVWETGVVNSTQPIRISGIFVNNTFYSSGTVSGAFAYKIDFPNGRVIFNTAIATNSNVKLAYSHKHYNVTPAKGIPWIRELQQGSFRLDDSSYSYFGSGNWAMLGNSKVQMPTLAIEVVPNTKFTPYQLGGGQNVISDIVYYAICENYSQCSNLLDIVSYQNDRDIYLFDTNKVATSGVFPLNQNGNLNHNALPSGLYPNLVDNHRYTNCTISNTHAPSITELSNNLWIGTVRSTATVVIKDI